MSKGIEKPFFSRLLFVLSHYFLRYRSSIVMPFPLALVLALSRIFLFIKPALTSCTIIVLLTLALLAALGLALAQAPAFTAA